jgi:ComF family protein
VFFHEGPAQRLVTRFKYDGQRALGRTMAELALSEFQDLQRVVGSAVVTWVPCHASGMRDRGYNQAEVFARELARAADVMVGPLVTKTRRTAHQRGLGREGRSRNLKGVFAGTTPSGALTVGREGVILVDDVYTTGATVAEVSRVLVASTRLPVHVFTFGRTPSDLPQRAD